MGRKPRMHLQSKKSLRWESDLLLNIVTQSSQPSQPVGKMETQEQGLPMFQLLSLLHTQGLCPCDIFFYYVWEFLWQIRCVFALAQLPSFHNFHHVCSPSASVRVWSLRSSWRCFRELVPVCHQPTGSVSPCSQKCQLQSFQSSEKSFLSNSEIDSILQAPNPSRLPWLAWLSWLGIISQKER